MKKIDFKSITVSDVVKSSKKVAIGSILVATATLGSCVSLSDPDVSCTDSDSGSFADSVSNGSSCNDND